MNPPVTALLVSHDGARWLPAVLDGLSGQTRPVDRVVAVDTGSTDGSAELVRAVVPELLVLAPRTSYPQAVEAALASAPALADDEWVWLLHDDSNPDREALARLLAAAERHPEADLLGPKLREWPSLRRLLEVGVTLSGTGRRETGLERGEYDQGQHDEVREVLAVNTAGLLVRRRVLDALGLDHRLPLFGNDLDLGWRAARSGRTTLVVPDAVVFHVEAAHRGARRTELSGPRPLRGERAAALYTLLVNGPAVTVPIRAVRLLLGSLLRALGFLLVRSPREALDEAVAVLAVLGRPWRVLAGRRARRGTATRSHQDVRHLLAPAWVPYRHGLDFLSDLATAVGHSARDLSAAHRSRPASTLDTGPVPAEAQELPADDGLLARAVRSPELGLLVALLLAALVAARGLYGAGWLSGGALLPAPGGAGDWWRAHLDLGSPSPAAPYLLPLALAGTLALGKAWLVVDLLVLLAVPLAAFGGFRFLRTLTSSRAVALWGGVAYGLLPVLTGAVQEGRLGTVAGAVVLPWLAHAALYLGPGHPADRRWRAAWRVALALALLAAFVPLALPMAAVVSLVAAALVRVRHLPAELWRPLALPVPVALVALAPWALSAPAGGWLFEAGLPAPAFAVALGGDDVLLARPGAAAAPGLVAGIVLAAAVIALARRDTRGPVTWAWAFVLLGVVTAAVVGSVSAAPAFSGRPQPVWVGFPVLVAHAALVCAAALAGRGVRGLLAGRSFGWRQPLGAGLLVAAVLAPAVGLGWWVLSGSSGPLERRPATTVPAYMTDAAESDPDRGVLVLRGDRRSGFTHLLLRGPGLRLGEDSLLPPAQAQEPLTDLVERLASTPDPADVDRLAALGVGFVHAPTPVDPVLAGNLDGLSGVTAASATAPGTRAWQLHPREAARTPAPESTTARTMMLVVQGAVLVLAVVGAAPTRRVVR